MAGADESAQGPGPTGAPAAFDASARPDASTASTASAPVFGHPEAAFDDAELDRICLHNLLSACADRIYFKDRGSRILRASRSTAQYTGAGEPSSMIGKTVREYFTPEQTAASMRTEQAIMRTGRPVHDVEEARLRPDSDDEVCLSTSKQPLRDFDGRIIGTYGISRDITARKAAEQQLVARTAELDRVSRELKALIDSSPDVMIRLDSQLRCTYVNPAGVRLSALSEQEILGRTIAQMGFGDQFSEEWDGALREVLERGEGVEREFGFPFAGREIYLHTRFVPEIIEAGEVRSILAVCRDLTERRRMEQVLAEQAVRDPLTGLANRSLLVRRITEALELGEDRLGVLFLDLDRFKTVNDSLGHTVGDEVLVAVAGRLGAVVRRADLVARFGGDEFVIVCHDVEGEADMAALAGRVCEQFARPFACGGKQMHLSTSIGIALSEGPGTTADSLLRNADTAMYLAKGSGEGGSEFRFFEPAAHAKAVDRIDLEDDLRHAAERGELGLVYQPIVELASGRVIAAEALIRWHHPTRGVLLPADFIPMAEETDLIVPIGRWVLDQACRQLGAWSRAGAGGAGLMLAINLSNRQLARDPHLLDAVTEALARHDLTPERLWLEVTESAAHDASSTARRSLAALSEAGLRVALDDYGTGYSSLAHLREISVGALKIDPTFVTGMSHHRGDDALVVAVIALAHALGLRAVAEGVETPEQRDRLREAGCDLGQGHLFSQPLGALEFARLLEA